MKYWSESDFGVHDAVGGQILSAFVSDTLDCIAMLHDASGVGERLEVEHEIVAFSALVEPEAEFVDVGRR